MTLAYGPPPWSVDDPDMKPGQECFIVRDANGQALAYVYFEDEREPAATKPCSAGAHRCKRSPKRCPTHDEARASTPLRCRCPPSYRTR